VASEEDLLQGFAQLRPFLETRLRPQHAKGRCEDLFAAPFIKKLAPDRKK
jgi:hypothetical protein